MLYFSERETGIPNRAEEEISDTAWKGICAMLSSRMNEGAFGMKYPIVCEDYGDVIGANWVQFDDAALAEIPNLNRAKYDREPLIASLRDKQPSTLDILDLIEFCWRNVSKVEIVWYHDFFRHNHLAFDGNAGRNEFREEIERIFRRNRIAYELTEDGRIERTTPRILGDLSEMDFDTGDAELDRLLNTASVKFRSPDQIMRREALESLWDAWERIKTLDSSDKKAGIAKLLDSAAGENSPQFRDALEREAAELTKVGNKHRIRHSETHQEMLANNEHVDYLFYRMLSLIHLVIRSR